MDFQTPREQFNNMYGPNFDYFEMACKCETCKTKATTPKPLESGFTTTEDDREWFTNAEFKAFMFKLIKLRNVLGWPFNINSGYRCPDYNDSLYSGDGTHRDGPHTIGAADVGCAFERAYQLIDLATRENMGVGPTQHGPVADRFIHVDNQGPRIWTY